MNDVAQCLPYALEAARQLHDASKPLYLSDIELRWDADFALYSSHALVTSLEPFEAIGALHRQQAQAFLPRRRRRECPFHNTVCLPTREDPTHHALAIETYRRYAPDGWHCPVFLVDLLDPWPRGCPAPTKATQRDKGISAALRYYILQRDSFRCQLCGIAASDGPEVRLAVDHKTSCAHWGSDASRNLWVLCALCNAGKGAQSL